VNEIKRPASVRELIDHLPRASLIYLCEQRGLAVSRANDDCRSSISRSYRGQRDDLLQALRKDDLVTLLRLPVRHRNALFDLPNPHLYSRSELTTLAIRAFGRLDELFAPFVERGARSAATGTANPTPATPAPSATPATPPTPPEPPSPLPPPEPSSAGDLAPPSVGTRGWSRLQPISALFSRLGLETPTGLDQDSFGALIEQLELRGFEVADATGALLTPLHDALPLDAEVRIRHDAHLGPVSVTHGTSRSEPPKAAVPELGDYARASLRLELLTSCLEPGHEPRALEAVVDAATAGTALEPAQRALLASVAKSLASVPRSAFSVLTALHGRLDQEDVEILIRDLGLLETNPETVYELGEHWASLHAQAKGTIGSFAEGSQGQSKGDIGGYAEYDAGTTSLGMG
jgi:hypothetical protein